MSQFWSTDQVRPQDRLAYWVEVVCRTLVPVECVAHHDGPFFGRIEADTLGPIHVTTVVGTAQIASRRQRDVARDPRDAFALHISGSGVTGSSQLGRETVLRPGDIALHDMNRPFEFNFPTDWAQTVLLFPREALLSRIGNIEPRIGLKLEPTGVAGMLAPLLSSLPAQLARIPGHVRERVADNLLDLVASAIVASSDKPLESSGVTLARVKLWIERHLGEALSADIIATQCRMSSRHLNRLFALENTSLMQFVLERRLARCHRDLTDPAMGGRSITDIALAAGFNDLSHFSRSYRARFGCAPKESRLGVQGRVAAQEPT